MRFVGLKQEKKEVKETLPKESKKETKEK